MKKFVIWANVMVGLSSMAFIAAAQVPSEPEAVTVPALPQVSKEQRLREFGVLNPNILNIGASQFVPRGAGNAFSYYGSGYVTAGASQTYWAPVVLPTGARLTYLDLFACDTNSSTSHVVAYLTAYPSATVPAVTNLASVASSLTPGNGCSGFWVALNHTINNDVYTAGSFYVINLGMNSGDFTNRFKGVALYWVRQVSPAPASASFTDVPTGHWAFQWIEALKASGITQGCAAGVYCPDNNVTRAEMAVFLSRALGLQWSN